MHADRRHSGPRGAPRAEDERARARRPRLPGREASKLGGERRRVGVVRHEPASVAADQRVRGARDPGARVERIDQGEHALLVRHGDVEPIVEPVAKLLHHLGQLFGVRANGLVRVRQAERPHRRALHDGTLRVADGIAHDREAADRHSRLGVPAVGAVASSASTLSTTASSRASRTRTWIL